MKTKLLRKIRRRYAWYYKENGDIVLLDKYRRDVMFIDNEIIKERFKAIVSDPASEEELKHRLFLEIVGVDLNEYIYRKAFRKYHETKRT